LFRDRISVFEIKKQFPLGLSIFSENTNKFANEDKLEIRSKILNAALINYLRYYRFDVIVENTQIDSWTNLSKALKR
jgi:hypothetical protein